MGEIREMLYSYLAKFPRPTPVVLFIHGGGFRTGIRTVSNCRNSSRFWMRDIPSRQLIIGSPTLRLHRPHTWIGAIRCSSCGSRGPMENPDATRVASTGSRWCRHFDAAGLSTTTLRIPTNADPITRQSTRLTCVAVENGQSSHTILRFAEKIGIPRPNFEDRHEFFLPFYGITAKEIDTPKAYQLSTKKCADHRIFPKTTRRRCSTIVAQTCRSTTKAC